MRIYYKLEEFNALNLDINEAQKERINKANKLAEEVNKFYPATMLVEVENDSNGTKHYERPHVFFKMDAHLKLGLSCDYLVSIQYFDHAKQYIISAKNNFGTMDYITTRDINEYDETNKLNKIGKLSAKKIEFYLIGIDQTYKALTKLSKERAQKVEDFKKKLEGQPVNYWREEKSGSIRKGGLVYEFAIEDSGYISEKIRVDFTSNLDDFLKMSDNKF